MEFSEYMIYMYNFALGVGAILAFVMIIIAGIKISRSGGNPSERQEGKKQIINSLIGLTVLLTSYILLTTINPDLVNISTINLSGSSTGGTINSSPTVNNIKNYSFDEIPIGTITEAVLAGTSSTVNALPCYEYEHKAYNGNGTLIIGNTIDKNGDGAINEKDALLDKDNFYCIKLLDDAIKKKVEIQLNLLTSELDGLMKGGCSCKRAYHQWFPPNTTDGEIKNGGPKCFCPYGISYCRCCGSRNGCPGAPFNPYSLEGEFKQYQYDVCGNRLALDCKRQEIRELMNGEKPDQVCYDKEYIKEKTPFNLLTIKDGINRLNAFKTYYDSQVSELESAEEKMKNPYGERLTLAEMYNNVETKGKVSVIKKTFDGYNISRYCRIANCTKGVCSLNNENRVCKMDGTEEFYSYSGDGATFYYNSDYNTDQKDETKLTDQTDNKCSIETYDMNKEMYGGLVRIGETVDYTEAWGKEVSKRIDLLKGEVQKMYWAGMQIYDFPDGCSSSNCTNSSANKINICTSPGCCRDCGEGCNCNNVSITSCRECEPTETICAVKEVNGSCSQKVRGSYSGCSSYCGGWTPTVYQVQQDYWTCPYRSLYGIIASLYQRRVIERSCYEESEDKDETSSRANKLAGVGVVQKMEEREAMLFELASVGTIVENPIKPYESVSTVELFGKVFSDATYLIPEKLDDLKCDAKLSTKLNIENRFTLFDMLKTSRERLTGCVTGYSYPYKKSADTTRVMSCHEASNTSLILLPEFPYPDMSKAVDPKDNTPAPYINCYPYNSSALTKEEKMTCFYNINRTGVEGNEGCLMITKNYMDNYYCCQ